jgi:3-phenylpropionate/trans-cinnamate dioxygenase ferredoxin subunit
VSNVVCSLDEFESGTARRVVVDGRAVALVRIGDDVYAIDDVCSHANVSLSDGEVWSDSCMLECPKHGSSFNLTTGEPDTLPATRPVAVHAARVEDGMVIVEVAS